MGELKQGIYITGLDMPKDDELLCINIYPSGKVCISMDLNCTPVGAATSAADVVEVRHGRWIKDCDRVMGDGWTYTQRHCSECGGQTVECVNYCQFCGAKMDGGQD